MSELKADLIEIKTAIHKYLRHPVEQIRQLPSWEWRKIMIAQIAFTMATGAISGLIHRSALGIIAGVIETPILTLITTFISSLFFFYVFQIFQQIYVTFRELYIAVFFANLPFFIFQTISDFFPPILVVGLAFSAMLLVVAFASNFRVERKFAMRLVGSVYTLLVVVNLIAWWNTSKITEKWQSHSSTSDRAPEVKLGN